MKLKLLLLSLCLTGAAMAQVISPASVFQFNMQPAGLNNPPPNSALLYVYNNALVCQLPDGSSCVTGGGGGGIGGSGTVGTLPIFVTNTTTLGNSHESEAGGIFNIATTGGMALTGTGPTLFSGKIQAGTSVTVPATLDFSTFLGSDNVFRCQLASTANCLTPTSIGYGISGTGLNIQTTSVVSSVNGDVVTYDAAGNTQDSGVLLSSLAGGVSSVANSDSTLTISPTTGAVVASLNLGHANTWTAVQTFTNSDFRLLGSSTGYTTFTSGNASSSNYVATFPANSGTVGELNLAQTWSALQTFGSNASIAGTAHGVLLSENTSAAVATSAGAADSIFMGNDAGTGSDPAFKAGPGSCSSGSSAVTYNTSTHAWGCNTISGSGTVNSGTATHLAYYATSTTAVSSDATATDDGTTFTYSGTGGITASAGPLTSGLPAGGVGSSIFLKQEGTVPTGLSTAGQDDCYADSTQHGILCNFNAGTTLPLVQGPASTTAGHFPLWNATNGGLLKDLGTDFVFATHSITTASTAILDLSSATGTAAFKLPTNTSNTASAAGVLDYDSTNSNYHGYNGADAIVGIFNTVPTTAHLVAVTVSSGKVTLSDGGAVPGTATTVNGQTCTLGSTCAVESATSGQMAVSGGSGAALTGAADMTYSTHTFATTASGIFDWSAATGSAALKVPSTTTNTASAAGVIDYDTTNSNYHANSGADSLVGVVPTANVPTTGHLIDALVASSKFLLHDSGVVTANVVNASSPGAGIAHFAGSTQTVTSSAVALADMSTQSANTILGNYTAGSATPTAGAAPSGGTSGCAGSTDAVIYTTSTGWGCHQITGSAPSLDQVTGSAAQATATETGTGHEYSYAGVETGNLTAPVTFKNTNSANNNTSIGLLVGAAGTSTGGIGEVVFDVSGTGDIVRWYSGGSVSNGVYTVGTLEAHLTATGLFEGTFAAGSTAHGVLISEGTSSAAVATSVGATNTVLHGNTGADPTYSAVADGDLTGTVGVAHGGTSLATLTAHALYAGNGASAPTAVGPDASTTKALFSAGSSADPAFRAIAAADLPVAASVVNSGTITIPSGNAVLVICSSTCSVPVPVPVLGYQICVKNEAGVSTVITLSALGSSAAYPKSDDSGYGTAGTGTMVSSAASGNKVCLIGRDSTHYELGAVNASANWTVN